MTLPTNINLPISTNDKYLKQLSYALSTYLQQTNFECNGTYNNLTEANDYPFIAGSSSAGVGVYSSTVLFTQRANLINRVWFDITWTGHTGTGNLTILLPYYAQFVAQNPFVGVIQSDGITFDAGYTYLVGNITPDTNILNIMQCGSGVASIPIAIPTDGTLKGSIIYAGQQFS